MQGCKLEVFDFSAAAPKGVEGREGKAFVKGEIRSYSSGLGGLRKQSLYFSFSVVRFPLIRHDILSHVLLRLAGKQVRLGTNHLGCQHWMGREGSQKQTVAPWM